MYSFSDDQILIRKMTDQFVDKYVRPGARDRDRNCQYPAEILDMITEHGYKGANIPPEYGGAGLDPASAISIIHSISRVDSSLAHILEVNNFGFCEPIERFGTEEQKKKYLHACTCGDCTGTFAYTEAGGSDIENINLEAEKTPDGYLLNGSKIMVTNARNADYALVVARTSRTDNLFYGISFLIVSLKSEGVVIGKPEITLGQRSINLCEIRFQDCKTGRECLLGAENEGLKILLSMMDTMRISVSAMALGIAETALEEAMKFSNVPYHNKRKMYEVPAVKNYIAEMASKLEIMRMLVYNTLNLRDKSESEFRMNSLITKLYVCESAKEICDMALQIHGGCGYISEYEIERLYRDIRGTTIFGLTSERAKSSIADNFIKKYLERGEI